MARRGVDKEERRQVRFGYVLGTSASVFLLGLVLVMLIMRSQSQTVTGSVTAVLEGKPGETGAVMVKLPDGQIVKADLPSGLSVSTDEQVILTRWRVPILESAWYEVKSKYPFNAASASAPPAPRH